MALCLAVALSQLNQLQPPVEHIYFSKISITGTFHILHIITDGKLASVLKVQWAGTLCMHSH